MNPSPAPPFFRVLDIPVHAVQIPDVVSEIQAWIKSDVTGRYVAVTGMHGIAESRSDIEFRRALESAALIVPDGMPLVWLGRCNGHKLSAEFMGRS